MADFGLTAAGFNRKRLATILAELEAGLKSVFGEDIDVTPESGFGQFNGIMSEALANQNEEQENVYNSQYPSTASGAALSNVVEYNGIIRQDSEKSTALLTLTGTEGTVITAGSEANVTVTGKVFKIDSEVTIPAGGTIDVTATAKEFGAISAGIGTITTIGTPIFGWTTVTNTVAAITGREEEDDPELRDRREISTVTLGQNLQDSLFGQLLNLDGVEDSVVISNRTKVVDANGIPPNEFLSVISGGDVTEIANTIWKNTPQGINSFGALTETITDAQGFPQDVNYSRPSDINIYFVIDIEINVAEFPGTGVTDIKNNVVGYGEGNFKISDDVIRTEFYSAINQTPGILSIVLKIDVVTPAVGLINIPIAADEISRYHIARVDINIV